MSGDTWLQWWQQRRRVKGTVRVREERVSQDLYDKGMKARKSYDPRLGANYKRAREIIGGSETKQDFCNLFLVMIIAFNTEKFTDVSYPEPSEKLVTTVINSMIGLQMACLRCSDCASLRCGY